MECKRCSEMQPRVTTPSCRRSINQDWSGLDCPIDWIVETARNGAKRFDMGSECRVFTADRGEHARPQQYKVKPKG